MNPVGEEGNIFSNLFDKVPARRAGGEEDIASVVIYLASRAGVSVDIAPKIANIGNEVNGVLQAYVDGISVCVDGGRILLANGQ